MSEHRRVTYEEFLGGGFLRALWRKLTGRCPECRRYRPHHRMDCSRSGRLGAMTGAWPAAPARWPTPGNRDA